MELFSQYFVLNVSFRLQCGCAMGENFSGYLLHKKLERS